MCGSKVPYLCMSISYIPLANAPTTRNDHVNIFQIPKMIKTKLRHLCDLIAHSNAAVI